MDNLDYLAAAFGVVWVAISIYVFSLSRRQKKLWQEIDTLKERMRGKEEN